MDSDNIFYVQIWSCIERVTLVKQGAFLIKKSCGLFEALLFCGVCGLRRILGLLEGWSALWRRFEVNEI